MEIGVKCDLCFNELKNFHMDSYHIKLILNGEYKENVHVCYRCYLKSLGCKKIPMMELNLK